MEVSPTRLQQEEIVLTGNRYATRAEIAASLELVRLGRVAPVVGRTYPLEALEEAFEAIRANDVFGRILIDCS